jgi:ATP-dependent protease ClpP protease subunit
MPAPTANKNEPAKWYTIRASAKPVAGAVQAALSAEILIYGDIGESWYDDTIAAKDFVREVAALDVDAITVRINSFGGSVTDGIAIFNALKRHKAKVTTVVDAIAASVASLIAMSGDTIEMAENALLMIHAPWMQWVSGNAVTLRKHADILDTYSDAMASSYASRSQDKAGALALLQDGKDHWYTAEEALAAKFIDQIVASLPAAAAAHIKHSIQARYASFPHGTAPAAPPVATLPTTPKENTTMPTPAPAAAAAPADDAVLAAARDAAVAAALAADKTRRTDINATFAKFSNHEGMAPILAACLEDQTCTVDQANAKIVAQLGKDSTPVAAGRIITLEDSRDKFRNGAEAALLAKAKLGKDDTANNFRSFGLMDLARECLAHAGVNARGMDKMALVAAAFTHTGSDFPLLLQNVADKAMLKGYEEADETFQKWTSKGVLGDFKPGKRVDLNSFPTLGKVQDGGEYSYATIGERGETVQLATYGKLFSITRQTIINDDLDAFSKIPRRMGRAAIRTIGDLVYAILTSNQVMRDNVALFHATHKNLMTGSGISTGSVDAMRVLMGKQTDGNAVLNIRLAQLLVPLALEGTASVVRDSEYEVGAATKNNTTPNFVRGTFEVISDARLDAASATAWYGTANSGVTDTVEVSYLDGVETPTLEQKTGWNVDGVEFKVRMDAGVAPLDFRTMVSNPGA